MRGHRIIQNHHSWQFEFIPNNSNTQHVGYSKFYDTYDACKQGVLEFRELVLKNQIHNLDTSFTNVVIHNNKGIVEYIYKGEAIFRSREFYQNNPKTSCKKSVASIYKYIEEYTAKQLT